MGAGLANGDGAVWVAVAVAVAALLRGSGSDASGASDANGASDASGDGDASVVPTLPTLPALTANGLRGRVPRASPPEGGWTATGRVLCNLRRLGTGDDR